MLLNSLLLLLTLFMTLYVNVLQPTAAICCRVKSCKAVQDVILKNGALNAAIVGQPAYKIAELAGFSVPENTKILIGEVTVVDESEPFAHEKLSPTLAMYRAKDF